MADVNVWWNPKILVPRNLRNPKTSTTNLFAFPFLATVQVPQAVDAKNQLRILHRNFVHWMVSKEHTDGGKGITVKQLQRWNLWPIEKNDMCGFSPWLAELGWTMHQFITNGFGDEGSPFLWTDQGNLVVSWDYKHYIY